MKKKYFIPIFSFVFINALIINFVFGQKKISELTIVYDYVITSNNNASKPSQGYEGATNTIYIKGNMSRSEIVNSLYSSTTIYDANANSGIILKEVSGQKLLIRVSPANWQQINKTYEGLVFTNTSETKTIAGYKCMKAVAKTKDGYTFTVYYTNEIIPENKNYNAKFKNLDGLPLEYELNNGTISLKYTVSKINLNPVPASKFDIPKTNYREMTYEESKKLDTKN
jgi:GLPGLI family protein